MEALLPLPDVGEGWGEGDEKHLTAESAERIKSTQGPTTEDTKDAKKNSDHELGGSEAPDPFVLFVSTSASAVA